MAVGGSFLIISILTGFLNNEADWRTYTEGYFILILTGDLESRIRIGEGDLVSDILLRGFISTMFFLLSRLLASYTGL